MTGKEGDLDKGVNFKKVWVHGSVAAFRRLVACEEKRTEPSCWAWAVTRGLQAVGFQLAPQGGGVSVWGRRCSYF